MADMARNVEADLEALAELVETVRIEGEGTTDHIYGELIALAESVIDDLGVDMADRVRAMQLMEDAIGDGATITESDVHEYRRDING
jgi:hypothetical protein